MSTAAARPIRRLAAIFAADVAGYSRLMGLDDEGTLQRLSERRTEMDALINLHGGRVANTAGDSVVAEFPSVVAALECAIAVQRAHSAANITVPEDRRVAFRIGLHVGEVLVKDGDLFGDGVNIAARIEQLAEPGGITASARAREEVGERIAIDAESLGLQTLKNIARPVEIWRVTERGRQGKRLSWTRLVGRVRRTVPRLIRNRRAAAAFIAALSVAAAGAILLLPRGEPVPVYMVMPFTATGDPAAMPLAAGITARLADGLTRVPGIQVLASTDPAQGAQAPTHLVAGSVRLDGQNAHVDARLVEQASGRALATSSVDVPVRGAGETEDEILGAIGDDIAVAVNRLRFDTGAGGPDAEAARKLAEEARNRIDLRAEPDKAIDLYEKAVRLDPKSPDIAGWYANALVAVASYHAVGSDERKARLGEARRLLDARKDEVGDHRLLGYAQCQLATAIRLRRSPRVTA